MEQSLEKAKAQVCRETGLPSPAALRVHLENRAPAISFAHGSGKRKSEAQRSWGKQSRLLERWNRYEE